MGLLSALSNAVSGLSVNQQNLDVLSQNISNANTANYSNEVLNQAASFTGGQGTGVSTESITRTVNEFMAAQVQEQTSNSSAATAIQSYYSQIENILGQPGGTSSVDQAINSFFTAAQTEANSPSVSSQTTMVDAATTAASTISSLASSLQNYRLQADGDISSAVSSVNTDLAKLHTLNNSLERAAATGQSTAGLLDQRDATLNDIAQYVNITPTYQEDGEVTISTGSGITLLNPTTVSQLSYTPVSSVNTLVNNDALSPITVTALDASGNPIGASQILVTGGLSSTVTTSVTGGKLQGLLSVRDSIVPNILGQLDQLASNFRDQVNAVQNSGTSSPPPTSYTGTRLLSGASTSQYSGSVMIAVLDGSGNPIPSPYADETNGVQPLTLNLATLNSSGNDSVDNIINSINQYYGSPQNKAELGNLNNVQLQVASPNVPDNGKLSVDFNLNNISGTNAAFYVTGATVLDSSGNVVDASPTVSSPSTAVTSYTTQPGTGTLTLASTNTSNLVDGQTVYLNPPASAVNGIAAASLGGYFTVSNVTPTGFQITVAGATANSSTSAVAATGITAISPSTTVTSGQTVNTASNGLITANLGTTSTTTPYFTIEANIASVNSSGAIVTSTVSYRVPNNTYNSTGTLIGASNVSGNGVMVSPTTNQPLAVASLVDANGNPLSKTNGSYGNQQGYLKISAGNSSETIAINQLDSKQLGITTNGTTKPGTNQGFSQYFGLNNLFNMNSPIPTGDTVANSAMNLSVSNNIIANPGLLSTGQLTVGNAPANSADAPNYTYVLNSGDNSISQKLASLATAQVGFGATAGMSQSSTTFSQYAGQIIAVASTNSTNATNTMNDSQTLLSGFTTQAQSVSGVNLDQELANTVIYQNAYPASTRVITIVSQMFDSLLGIIQ